MKKDQEGPGSGLFEMTGQWKSMNKKSTERPLPREIERFHELAAQCRHVQVGDEALDLTAPETEVEDGDVVLTLKLTARDCRAIVLADQTLRKLRQRQLAKAQMTSEAKARTARENGAKGGRPVGTGKKKPKPEAAS